MRNGQYKVGDGMMSYECKICVVSVLSDLVIDTRLGLCITERIRTFPFICKRCVSGF